MADALGPAKRALAGFTAHERAELMYFLAEGLGEIEASGPKRSRHVEWRTCRGRPCATCDAGGRHGPYIYEAWREGGKVRKKYVRKGLADEGPAA